MTAVSTSGKLAEYFDRAKRAYEGTSRVADLTTVVSYNAERDSQKSFLKTGYRRRFPASWFTDDTVFADSFFIDIGRQIAFNELAIILRDISGAGIQIQETMSLNDLFTKFIASALQLHDTVSESNVLLATIDLYSDLLYLIYQKGLKETTQGNRHYLQFPDGSKLQVIWSSNLVPFDDFIVVNNQWANWTAKPTADERFQKQVISERAEFLDIEFHSVYNLEVKDKNKIRRFSRPRE